MAFDHPRTNTEPPISESASGETHYRWNDREQRAVPVAIDSPPPAQQVVQSNHYVPYETGHFQNAYAWAASQVARKLPAAVETLNMLDSLIQQQMNGRDEA